MIHVEWATSGKCKETKESAQEDWNIEKNIRLRLVTHKVMVHQ